MSSTSYRQKIIRNLCGRSIAGEVLFHFQRWGQYTAKITSPFRTLTKVSYLRSTLIPWIINNSKSKSRIFVWSIILETWLIAAVIRSITDKIWASPVDSLTTLLLVSFQNIEALCLWSFNSCLQFSDDRLWKFEVGRAWIELSRTGRALPYDSMTQFLWQAVEIIVSYSIW